MRVVLEAVSEMARLGANHHWDPFDTHARAAVAKAEVLPQIFLRR